MKVSENLKESKYIRNSKVLNLW